MITINDEDGVFVYQEKDTVLGANYVRDSMVCILVTKHRLRCDKIGGVPQKSCYLSQNKQVIGRHL